MRQLSSVIFAPLTIACSLATISCSGSGGVDGVLNPPGTMPFGTSEIPIVAGLAMGADPTRLLLDAQGLATDVLTIDEDNARTTAVGATTSTLSATHTVPVGVLPTPPISLALSPVTLEVSDRKMYEIVASFPGMECRVGATFVLESVTSSEADDGTGAGDIPNDIQGADIGTADASVFLRAERADLGTGRTYTFDYRVIDGSGTTAVRTGTVQVP